MNLQPVIQRELQVASRRRETWRLRLAFSGGAMAAFAFGMLLPNMNVRELGKGVLICLAICGFGLSLFSGAYLTADAVSSEKREGTLGLLFLTPLNGREIVLGKMLTHSLQVSYALLGGFPLFFLPIILGGVLWGEVTRLLLVMLVTLLLSLACGMFWSTVARDARGAVLGTAATMALLTFLPWLLPFMESLITRRGPHLAGLPQLSPMTQLIFAFDPNYRALRSPGLQISSGAFIYWGSLGCSLVFSLVLLWAAGWLLPRIWRKAEAAGSTAWESAPASQHAVASEPRSCRRLAIAEAPQLWMAARGLREPRGLSLLRSLLLAFFGIMLMLSGTIRNPEVAFIAAFCSAYGVHLLTRIQLALTATSRLAEDRRSGALEILLTTPVADAEVISAFHQSLNRAFRPRLHLLLATNAALLCAMTLFATGLHIPASAWVMFAVFFVGGAALAPADFSALRWLSLRAALRSTTPLKATGRAFGLLAALSWLTFAATFLIATSFRRAEGAACMFAFWFLFRLLCDWVLIRRCRWWLQPGLRLRAAEG